MKNNCYRVASIILASFITIFFLSSTSFAQGNIRIVHDTTMLRQSPNNKYLGRDLWFCIPQNYVSSQKQDKFYHIYVTSERNTTVNFQLEGSAIVKKPLTKNTVIDFSAYSNNPPLGDFFVAAEMNSSGIVETNKAIHVWSTDADISVYLLSSVPFSTDGMYVVPTTGWGTEYAVGAYQDLYFPNNGNPDPLADWPSEFAVVADQDNTNVTITPSWDLRTDGDPSPTPTVIAHPRDQSFNVRLNKGECIQYQAIQDLNDPSCDVTGTHIVSDKPIGVMGASAAPYLPGPWPADCCGDYILDMMQPVKTWSNTYYTCPFAKRKYAGDTYLMVGTHPGQIIYRNGAQVAVLATKFGFFYVNDIQDASLWTSDSSFMLMQYMEGQYRDIIDQNPPFRYDPAGDPCSVVINAKDQFTKKIIFQTPIINKNRTTQNSFTNFVNLILPITHEKNTTFDGVTITGGAVPPNSDPSVKKRWPIGNTGYEGIQFGWKEGSGEGAHIIVSDTGVGCYIYGMGHNESYAWSGALGVHATNDPDTIPPVAIGTGPCMCARVRLYDVGKGQSKINSMDLDSSFNMTFYPDTNYFAGKLMDSTYYDMCVIDSSLPAILRVIVEDKAGNVTTVTSTYSPEIVKFSPSPALSFGTVVVGNTAYLYDTICNTGKAPFHYDPAKLEFLSNGKQSDAFGFTIDSAGSAQNIPVGGCIRIKINFQSLVPPTVRDTLALNDECLRAMTTIIGNGGAAEFDITNYTFDCTQIKSNRPSIGYLITDPTGIPATIDSVWIDDNVNFGYDKTNPLNKLPFTIAAAVAPGVGSHEIIITFNPPAVGSYKTIIHVKSGGTIKTDTIFGLACAPNIVQSIGNDITTCDNQVIIKVPLTNRGNLYDSIFTVSGQPVNGALGFSAPAVKDTNDNVLTLPFRLNIGQTVDVSVAYTPTMGTSGCFTDSITVFREGSELAVEPKPYITVCVKYFEMTVDNPAPNPFDFGVQPVGGAQVTKTLRVCNTGKDPLTISSIDSLTPDGSAFKLTGVNTVNGVTTPFPVTLAVGECLEIGVMFDPAKNKLVSEIDSFRVSSNDCKSPQKLVYAKGSRSNSVPSALGFTNPPLFSCDVHQDTVTFTNPTLLAGKITGITVSGPDAVNFPVGEVVPAAGIPVAAQSTHKIPINFTPAAQAGMRTYTATVNITFDGGGGPQLYTADVTGTGQGMDLTVTSQFTGPVQKASPGTIVTLPVQLALNKHALLTPLDFMRISKIKLVYTYNMNILDIVKNDIVNAVTFPVGSQWSVDAANSSVNYPGKTLTVMLARKSGVLNDADISQPIANIAFTASVPDSGANTSVTLAATDFLDSLNNPISPCVAVTKRDSTFSLVYECGDSTLQNFMTKGIFPFKAYPVIPNPSSGGILSFKYATKIPAGVTLEIYDELGNLADRVINNQMLLPGAYEIRYNSSRLAAGNYIYRYSISGNGTVSGRFVIEK